MNLVDHDELINFHEDYVDGSWGYYFAKGNEVLEKAKKLVKEGYVLVNYFKDKDDMKIVNLNVVKNYVGDEAGVPFGFTGYKEIYDWVDEENKIYYFRFSGRRCENFGC